MAYLVCLLNTDQEPLKCCRSGRFRHRIFDYPPELDTLYADHIGYTLYDLAVWLSRGENSLDMWLHHILGIVGSIAIMVCLYSQ